MSRTAIVTGAASGIGAAAVVRLRRAGFSVVAVDRNPEVETRYGTDDGALGLAGDVTDPEFGARVVSQAQAVFGAVDRLVHCAGIMPGGHVADVNVDQILAVMRTNYDGTV